LDLVTEVRAVLLDALGTLVELQPPAPRLRRLLRESGFDVTEERAAAGFMAEIAYYLDHHLDGADPERLERLRDRCADEMMRALALPGLDHATARRVMLGALEFTPYPDVLPALGELRERGLRLVIASNWDCSLPEWLGPTGILELVDGVVTSAEVGAAKPSTRVFERALALAGVEPGEALHVGDKIDNDVEGAAAAGVRGVLLQREGPPPPGIDTIRSLRELPALL
jgi:putative hydrolase of the HAD superfamily